MKCWSLVTVQIPLELLRILFKRFRLCYTMEKQGQNFYSQMDGTGTIASSHKLYRFQTAAHLDDYHKLYAASKIEKRGQRMIEKQLIGEWTDTLASRAPVPGGGGASALGGALGAALGQMVANLTVGKKRYADVEEEMQQSLAVLGRLQTELLDLADQDAQVFAPLAAAYSMPTDTPEQKARKEQVMEERLLAASLVPLAMMEKAAQVLEILEQLEAKGSRMAISDVGVAVQFARTALTGAVMNVYINTKSMKNREKAGELNRKADRLLEEGIQQADTVYDQVRQRLQG